MNPAFEMRWRAQTYTIDTDEPLESEWYQLRADAIKDSQRRLQRIKDKFGENTLIIKIFNELNSKQEPIIVKL